MRKNILRWVIASLVICLLTGNLAVFAETTGQNTDQTFPAQPDFIIPETVGNAAITAGCSTMDAQIPLITNEKILETAQAAILYEVNTDTLIYNWNADKKIYPGALTKVMTVLVALEKGDLEETVTVSRSVLNLLPIGTVVCKLQAGEELSLKDLLYCVMTASANDAALVVADHIAGSQEAFERRIKDLLGKYRIDLIVLAGFMSILSENFTKDYPERILNVHPSLIPSFCGKGFYGLRVHEEALHYGVKVTGATVHFVNEIPDGGKILLQKAVEIQEGDTPEILQHRVMEQAEWVILPAATEMVCKHLIGERER
jgi:phosphoribosylglycinamide formyltransferase-1